MIAAERRPVGCSAERPASRKKSEPSQTPLRGVFPERGLLRSELGVGRVRRFYAVLRGTLRTIPKRFLHFVVSARSVLLPSHSHHAPVKNDVGCDDGMSRIAFDRAAVARGSFVASGIP
jgi:hypothetical protein